MESLQHITSKRLIYNNNIKKLPYIWKIEKCNTKSRECLWMTQTLEIAGENFQSVIVLHIQWHKEECGDNERTDRNLSAKNVNKNNSTT